jgi:hypothetical protein
MNTPPFLALAVIGLALGLTIPGPADAQGKAGPGPNAAMPCADGPASAPCQGTGTGKGKGMGHGGMAGADYTHGWSMMTPQERSAHQARMQGMTSAADCRAYRDEHHKQMAERAKAQGATALPSPRHDACAGMKP